MMENASGANIVVIKTTLPAIANMKIANAICICNVTGHVASVCKSKEKVNLVSSTNVISVSDGFCEQLFSLHESKGTQPIESEININGSAHRFILNSGSSVSLVDKSTFYSKFSNFPLRHDEFNVCAYNGQRIEVAGYFEPTVVF